MQSASFSLIWLFTALAVLVAACFPLGLYRAERRHGSPVRAARRTALLAAAGTAAWMAVTGLAAARGVLRFEPAPPTMVVALVTMWTLATILGLSRVGHRLAMGLPLAALVGVQAFRFPLEMLMHRAAGEGVMPVQMSYSGLNFDIVTGVSAIVVAGLLVAGKMPLAGVRLWNWMGIVLLLNILVISMLSAPGPLRRFTSEPANVWVTQAPFVWLPMVLVMVAILGHIVILRRLRAESAARASTFAVSGIRRRDEKAAAPAAKI